MSGFGNFEFSQGQSAAEDNIANSQAQVPAQPQQPAMASQPDNQAVSFQGGATDPGSAGGPQPGGDGKTTLWSVQPLPHRRLDPRFVWLGTAGL